jgi:hypothetical protein
MTVLPEAKTTLSRDANRKANASPSTESDRTIIFNTKHYISCINYVRPEGKKKIAAFQIRNRIPRESFASGRPTAPTNIVPVFGVGEKEGLRYYVAREKAARKERRASLSVEGPIGQSI